MTQREQAELFRSYHLAPPVLVLPNVWDVATAVVVARTPGARAEIGRASCRERVWTVV